MPHEYKSLRLFARVFRITAWLALIIGLVGALGMVLGRTPETPRAMALVVLIVATLYFCLFSAAAQVIQLLLTLEERTQPPHTP